MILEIALSILFVALIILVVFRKKLLSLLEGKPKFERRSRDNADIQRAPQKRKPVEEVEDAEIEKIKAKRVAEERAAKRQEEEFAKREELARKAEEEKIAAAEKRTAELEKEAKKSVAPKVLPKGVYPRFSNSRLLDMGLTRADADIFVHELVVQIDEHIPQIEVAIKCKSYEEIEQLTHSLKGSATNLGTGGVADALVDYNTYCKKGNDPDILSAYLEILKAYQGKLKKEFS